MSDTLKAVFLSYASQDAEAAKRICEALRSAGVEVWFDQNELTGGDAWDQKIRNQIKACTLFVPVISAATNARREGYFRREWKIAVDRTHDMDEALPFLVPVVIDATTDAGAFVPEKFREVQWTRLPGGETPEKFCERIKKLLSGEGAAARSDVGASLVGARVASDTEGRGQATPLQKSARPWLMPALAGVAAIVAVAIWQPWKKAEPTTVSTPTPATRVTTAEKSAAPLTKAQQLIAQAQALYEPWDLATADDLKLADRLLKEATDLEPLNAEGWATLSILSFAQHSFDFDRSDARKEMLRSSANRAVKLAPDSRLAKLAIALHDRVVSTKSDEALHLLRELSARPDADKLTLRQLGSALRDRGEIDEAMACYDRAAALPGGDPIAQYLRGFIFEIRGQLDQAETAFDLALALRPDFAVAYMFKLQLLISHRVDLEAAKAMVQKMPVRLLDDERVASLAATVWYLARDADHADEMLRHVTKDYIEGGIFSGPKGLLAGVIHRLAGSDAAAAAVWRDALRVVEQRLALNSTAPIDLSAKAHLLALLGERPAAEDALRVLEQLTRVPAGRATADTWKIYAALGQDAAVADFIAGQLQAGGTPRARDGQAAFYLLDPALDRFRSRPRFVALAVDADRIVAAAKKSSAKQNEVFPAAEDKSVAVLAFANLSGDKDNEYFSDGISEELLNVLAKIPDLKVTARTSSFHFKGKDTPIPEIAKELGVVYVIEGSVRKAGTQVRIAARLIKAADGMPVWSDDFREELKDVFALQDKIAGLIAKNLSLKLGASSAAAVASVNPEAFELYLQAREAWRSRTNASLARAEELLNRALGLEPNFARAHAALADVWLVQGQNADTIARFGQRDGPEHRRLVAKAQQATALDPESAEAHSSLGACLWIGWRRTEAERELRRALALNSSYASAHHFLARVLMDEGRVDESLAEFKLAVEHDPLSSRIADNYGEALANAGRYREALTVLERAHQLQPENVQAEYFRASVLVAMGRADEGLAIVRDWPENDGDARYPKAMVLALAGQREKAMALLAGPEWQRFSDPLNWFVLEPPAEAFTKLDPVKTRSIFVNNWLFAPMLDPMRADPRFVKFIDTLGLTEANARAQAWRAAHPPEGK